MTRAQLWLIVLIIVKIRSRLHEEIDTSALADDALIIIVARLTALILIIINIIYL